MSKAEKALAKAALTGIDEVGWTNFGETAHYIPALVKELYQAKKYENAAMDLCLDFGGDEMVPAFPFLARVAADPQAPGGYEALKLLAGYADTVQLETRVRAEPEHAAMRSALVACAPLLLPCLAATATEIRRGVAGFFSGLSDVPAHTVAVLHDRLAVEDDALVVGALVSALRAHDALTEDEVVRLRAAPDQVRFAAAWNAWPDPEALQTLVALWNTCAAKLDLRAVGILMDTTELGAEHVGWLTDLALQGGTAACDALLSGFHTMLNQRRDLYPALCDALLRIASSPFAGFDDATPLAGEAADYSLTPRQCVVLVMVTAAPAAGDRRTELLDALAGIAAQAPVPQYDGEPHDKLNDIRADALRALFGWAYGARHSAAVHAHPGAMDMLRTLIANAGGDDVAAGSWNLGFGPLLGQDVTGGLRWVASRLPADQAHELAAIAGEQLRRPGAHGWLHVLAELPDEASRPWWDDAVEAARTAPDWSVVDTLVRWGTPAAVTLLEEWAEAGDLRRWATLALGVLRRDVNLVDEAFADGLPEHGRWFVALADEMVTSQVLVTCRPVLAGGQTPDGQLFRGELELACVQAVVGDDGLAPVWPTVLALVDDPDVMADAVSAATGLLARYPQDVASVRCRRELVAVLARTVEKGREDPYGNRDLAAPVVAATGLLDLGEPLPAPAARRATAMLKALGGAYYYRYDDALDDACRVLEAAGRQGAVRKKAMTALHALVDSPTRMQDDSEELDSDERFVSRLHALIDVLGS